MTDNVYRVLTKPKKIRKQILKLISQTEGIRLSMMYPSAIRYDSDKVQGSPSDPMARYIAKITTLEGKIDDLRTEYLDAQENIVSYTDQLPTDEMQIIILQHWIEGKDFKVIAKEIPMSDRNVFRIYKKAINILDNLVS